MEILAKKVVFLSLLFAAVSTAVSEGKPENYFSPGVYLGYTFKSGFTYGGQLTYGQAVDKFIVPGITLGIRKSQDMTFVFADAQLSFVFAGIGVGYVKYMRVTGNDLYRHVKLWGGAIGLLQYDRIYNDENQIEMIGAAVVWPFYDGTKIGGPGL